ncbi:hypothetical protein T492DRAFT_1150535 [Pavlovales sp. CCMP2436]|nr:hypothetical protein T492DRAFT_1150535 [Pavlovales sp. CCMP2436]
MEPRWTLFRASDGSSSNGRALVLDHRRGLEAVLLGSPERTIYCTALTRALLLARIPRLRAAEGRIVELPTVRAPEGCDNDGEVSQTSDAQTLVEVGSDGRRALLTAYDAGHCAGSVAIKVEAEFGVALFTGMESCDFRWDDGVGLPPSGRFLNIPPQLRALGENSPPDLLVVDSTCAIEEHNLCALRPPPRPLAIAAALREVQIFERATSGEIFTTFKFAY